MRNVYDIRRDDNLLYVLADSKSMGAGAISRDVYRKAAVLVYLYYRDTLPDYYHYMENIPREMDVYVISSRQDVLDSVRAYFGPSSGRKFWYIRKENRGRDVSALLVAGREIVTHYEYVCFLHDKKEHSAEWKADTQLWVENLWGNQIGSPALIDGILELFESNKRLGILTPPEPVGNHFNTWYGHGWYGSFAVTQKIARELKLHADIREDKPPITYGTVLWFRPGAIRKLLEAGWRYSDFDDGKLGDGNYLSYGIERIFAYVAQDAGYDAGTVMTAAYAGKQINYLQYEAALFRKETGLFFPVDSLVDLEHFRRNKSRIVAFAQKNRKVCLYGAGKMGRLCACLLRTANILPACYLVSGDAGESMTDCIPVVSLKGLDSLRDAAVVITAYDGGIQREMEAVLKGKGCRNYMRMWE